MHKYHVLLDMNTRLTTKTQYAVAAMLELARAAIDNNDTLSIATISANQSIDTCYLSTIFAELRRQQLVLSTRGIHGGYKLARPIEHIVVSEIMNAVGERIKITRCRNGDISCTGKGKQCSAHKMWKTLEENIERYFASITLYDLVMESDKFNNMMLESIVW